MAKAVSVYVEHVRSIAQRYPEKEVVAAVEQKIRLDGYGPDLRGTCDCSILAIRERTLYVMDYKHGAGVAVSPEDNPQCKYYALGALNHHGAEKVDRVVITIVQPRCPVDDDKIKEWECTPQDLFDFGLELMFGADATKDPNAPLNPGKWCRFCAAKGDCPALFKGALEAASIEFTEGVDPATVELPNVTKLTPEEVGRRLALADRLEAWLKALRQHAFAEASSGRMPAGFKLVAKRASRVWTDGEAAMHSAISHLGVDEDDVFTRKPISPAQLEKLVGKKAAELVLNDYCIKKSEGVRLAKLSAPGDPVSVDALSEFGDIANEESDD